MDTPQQFLTWLAVGGGYAAALAFVTERIPAFQQLSPNNKQLFHLVGSLVIAVGAYAALTYIPPATLDQIKPYFVIVSGVIGTWGAGQLAHNQDPLAAKKPEQVTIVPPHQTGDSAKPRDTAGELPPERKANGDLRNLADADAAPTPSHVP